MREDFRTMFWMVGRKCRIQIGKMDQFLLHVPKKIIQKVTLRASRLNLMQLILLQRSLFAELLQKIRSSTLLWIALGMTEMSFFQ